MLTIFLVVFLLFRSGSVNTVTGSLPSSYALDFDRLKDPVFLRVIGSTYSVYVPEQDLSSAAWLASRIVGNPLVYADSDMSVMTLIDYTTLNRQSIDYIANETQSTPGSYIYLRAFNTLTGIIASPKGYFNLSDLHPSPSQDCHIYSNGDSDIYFVP
jgi:uncharacterized membrane protein